MFGRKNKSLQFLLSYLSSLPAGDPAAISAFGIDYATKQCQELLQQGVVGLHIYTMDRSSAAVEIVSRLRSDGLL